MSTGLIGLVLAVVVASIYHPVVRHGFVNFDDPMYLYENGRVMAGLSADGWRWAWTNKDTLQWHPLTWLGHMVVSQLAGTGPAPHLLVNAALHWLNACLLFAWLRRATGFAWRSLAVALLFAVHPVNVETAAWASQLKSTLSTACLLGALLAYTRYAQAGGWRPYVTAVVATALGLMAKSMLVSLPLVLLLLDFWPLRRLPPSLGAADRGAWLRLLGEKVPFAVLALAGAVVTSVPWGPHSNLHTVHGLQWERVATVPLNYVRYVGLVAWPSDLAVMYPEKLGGPAGLLAASAVLLGLVTVWAWRLRKKCPAVLVGWGWFAATLGPVSGIIRIGPHGLADRYLYVPAIGLLVAAVWLVAESPLGRLRRVPAGLLGLAVLAYGAVAVVQVRYWENSLTLWRHAAAVTPPSAIGHLNLGNALLGAGRIAEAADELNAALTLDPADARPYINLAVIAQQRGDATEAVRLLRFALQLSPDDARIHSNLGSLLQDRGEVAEARGHLERAIALRPDYSEAHTNLGVLLAGSGDLAGARPHFAEAARLKPGDPTARQNLELVERQLRERRP